MNHLRRVLSSGCLALATLATLASVTTLASTRAEAAGKLAVFYPTTVPAQQLEHVLKADKALAGIAVTAFAKYRDFSFDLTADAPTYVIVPSAFARFDKRYRPVLQFTHAGRKTFRYEVLSLGGKWTAANFAKGSVGIVGQLERRQMKAYVDDLTKGGTPFRSFETVTKVEDLLPLLALENVNYILIEPENYETLKGQLATKVIKVGESVEVDEPVLCVQASGRGDAGPFRKLSPGTLKGLGFDGVTSAGGAP